MASVTHIESPLAVVPDDMAKIDIVKNNGSNLDVASVDVVSDANWLVAKDHLDTDDTDPMNILPKEKSQPSAPGLSLNDTSRKEVMPSVAIVIDGSSMPLFDTSEINSVTLVLDSPFHSPKHVDDDNHSATSYEEGEVFDDSQQGDENLGKMAESTTVLNSPLGLDKFAVDSNAAKNSHESIINRETTTTTDDEEARMANAPTVPTPPHSVPPHLRPEFKSTAMRHPGPQSPRTTTPLYETLRYLDNSRHSRQSYPPYQNQGYRNDGDREHFARLSAQLMKTKGELMLERKKNITMRQTVEAEQQRITEVASSSMLTSLLHAQGEALTQRAGLEAHERSLKYREQRIEQLEVYLAEGQKQLMYQLEAQDIRPMAMVDKEHIKRKAELSVRKTFADVQGKLSIQFERLRQREAAQSLREQQYKALIRDAMAAEFNNVAISPEQAQETAEYAYNRGFGAGKAAGRAEALDDAKETAWLEGYGDCHRNQVTLSEFRNGKIKRDHSDLDFLFDPGHLHNLYNIGARVAKLQPGKYRPRNAQKVTKEVGTKIEQATTNGHGHGREHGREHREVEEPTRMQVSSPIHFPCLFRSYIDTATSLPSPRTTFAAELRGKQSMHNGHMFLANGSSSSSATATPTTLTNGANGINGSNNIGAWIHHDLNGNGHTSNLNGNGHTNGTNGSNGTNHLHGHTNGVNGTTSRRAPAPMSSSHPDPSSSIYASRTLLRYEESENVKNEVDEADNRGKNLIDL